ncbi:MAG: hypothetical protein ACKO6B_15230 [Planctomycetia bacterium]
MQSFLAKCAALGIVAGGFAVTGDLGRLADRGRQLLDASTVPSETPAQPVTAADTPPRTPEAAQAPAAALAPAADLATAQALPAAQAPAAVPAPPRESLFDAPVGRSFAVPAPPAAGPESIDLESLVPGSRMLVWVRRPGVSAAGRSTDLIALDMIAPRSGEALEHRHAALTHGGQTAPVHAAPRRVVITRDAGGRIARGGVLRLASVRGVNGLAAEETVGTILALDVQGR